MTALVTKRSVVLGAFFAVLFAVITVFLENVKDIYITATQIAVLPYVLMLAMVLMINPLCRLLRRGRAFSVAEIMIIFIMGSVSAGLSTFGLTSQLVPVVSSLYNPDWNNNQTEWDIYVAPTIDERYFISVSGLREAAIEHREIMAEFRRLKEAYGGAARCARSIEAVRKAQFDADAARKAEGSEAEKAMRQLHADQVLEAAREINRESIQVWDELARKHALPDSEKVLAEFPDLIQATEKKLKTAREKLSALSERAGEKVKLFRVGLPSEKRAYPGLFFTGDTFETYKDRVVRLVRGLVARGRLRVAVVKLAVIHRADKALDGDTVDSLRRTFRHTIGDLKRIDTTVKCQARAREFDRRQDEQWALLVPVQKEIAGLIEQRRTVDVSMFGDLDSRIEKAGRREAQINKAVASIKKNRDRIYREMAVVERLVATIKRLEALDDRLAESGTTVGAVRKELSEVLPAFTSFDASLRRFLVGEVPWWHWGRPLLFWSILLLLTYIILMAFNVLIFRQWAYNEKLTYPLADLPQILAGKTDDDGQHYLPPVFRNGLFWAGFAVSAITLGWNLLCYSRLLPGLQFLDQNLKWAPYIQNTVFAGLLPSAKSTIFFTLIGLAFLIPARISFSLWLFSILYMIQLLFLVWSGYGVNEKSFPMEWYYTFNFRTAEGGGALMVFSAVVMYKCRRYILCFFTPKVLRDLGQTEQRELRISSFLFIFGSTALVLMLWLGMGANIWFTIFAYLVIMVITIGVTRSVAEGGMLGFQAWISPFHFIRTLFGMNKTWTTPGFFAPLMVYFSVMFLDIKTFIAPTMANCIKIRDDLRISRIRFHVAVFLAIILAAVASVVTSLFMSYAVGANNMNSWFYNSFPRDLYNQIASMARTPPVDTTGNIWWLAFGAVMMAGLLYFRQFLFWLPHPIGMIMLVNPIMRTYWFSFFVGWLAKSIVTKYGNKDTYARVRNFFIGLIAGELFIVILAIVVALLTGLKIPIDLNRN